MSRSSFLGCRMALPASLLALSIGPSIGEGVTFGQAGLNETSTPEGGQIEIGVTTQSTVAISQLTCGIRLPAKGDYPAAWTVDQVSSTSCATC